MAERLTDYFECGAYTSKENIIDVSDKVKFFDNGCVMGKAINKLGKLEDIMERLGINFVEDLEDEIKSLRVDKYVYKKDRDTWKRACELACDAMTKLGGDDCCGCRLDKKMCDICDNKKALFDYFYQQAKTEGNDERD